MTHPLSILASVIALSFVGIAVSTPRDPDRVLDKSELEAFAEFLENFNKTCDHGSKRCREQKKHFHASLSYIKRWNEENPDEGFKMGLTKFSDLSKDAFFSRLMSVDKMSKPWPHFKKWHLETGKKVQAGAYKDWREKGIITPVRDQGTCGDCWAFGATAAIESAYNLANFKYNENQFSFSDEYVWTCSEAHDGDCKGGSSAAAISWVRGNGIAKLSEDPYDLDAKKCKKIDDLMHPVAEARDLTGSVQTMLDYLENEGPIVASFVACEAFRHFTAKPEEVFTIECRTQPGKTSGHAVLLVGFGTSNEGVDYWIAKNSWGNWGQSGGYFKIKRDVCGIYERSVTAVIATVIDTENE